MASSLLLEEGSPRDPDFDSRQLEFPSTTTLGMYHPPKSKRAPVPAPSDAVSAPSSSEKSHGTVLGDAKSPHGARPNPNLGYREDTTTLTGGGGPSSSSYYSATTTTRTTRVQNAVDRNQNNRFLWEIAFKRRILSSITDYLYADDVHHLFTSSRILQNGMFPFHSWFPMVFEWKEGGIYLFIHPLELLVFAGSIQVEGLLRKSLWKYGFTPKNRLK